MAPEAPRALRDLLWRGRVNSQLLSLFAGARPSRCADVGAGDGELGDWLEALLGSSLRIDGFDADPEQVQRARRHHRGRARRFEVADAFDLPVRDGTYALTGCRALLVHTSDPIRVMAEMRRVTSAGGVLLAIEAVLRPEVWAEQTPTLHPEVSTLRRVVHAALLEGARRTGVGCWDAADRLGALAAEAGWVDCVLDRDVLELAAPTETGAASELRSALLEQWSADADEAEWETLRTLIEASGEPVEPFERLRALELPQRARELVELRRGRLPGPIRRAYVTAVGRPGGVSSPAS